MFYDIDKIKEEATPIGIIKYLERPIRRSGGTIFIECPVHKDVLGKADRHISNCELKYTFEKAFYCHSCNTSGSVFNLISGYLDLDMKKDFPEILRIAAESCGGAEYFLLNSFSQNKAKEKLEDFRISAEELRELGLKSSVYSTEYVAAYDESQLTDYYQLTKNINMDVLNDNKLQKISYLETKSTQHFLNKLEKEVYLSLIEQKAIEKMNLYKNLCTDQNLYKDELFSELSFDQRQFLSEGLKNTFRQKYIKVKNIYFKVASHKEHEKIDDSWLYDIA